MVSNNFTTMLNRSWLNESDLNGSAVSPPEFALLDVLFPGNNNTISKISLGTSITFFIASSILDFICVITVLRCRLRLAIIEFYILILNNLLVAIIKTCATIFILINVESKSQRAQLCLAKYMISVELFFCYYAVLFYYSLFHLALLKRTGPFQRLFHLVHSPIHFLAFIISVSVGFGTFLVVFALSNGRLNDPGLTLEKCFDNMGVEIFIPLMCLNVSYITVLVYMIASFLIWHDRVHSSRGSVLSAHETIKQHQKNLSLFTKFALYSLYTSLLSLAQNLPTLLLYSLDNINGLLLNQISSLIFNMLIFAHPLFLVLIHNILRSEFVGLIQLVNEKFRKTSAGEMSSKKSTEGNL